MTPAAIDAYVRSQLAAGEDLYTLHADALAALAPDLILTQDLCRVCALPAGHVEEALDYLGCSAEVVSLDPHRLDDVLATILTVGAHANAQPAAERLVAALRRSARGGRGPGRRRAPALGGGHRVDRPAVHRRALGSRPGDGGRRPPGRRPARRPLRADHLGADRGGAAGGGRGGPLRVPPGRRRRPGRAGRPRAAGRCRCGRSTPTASSSAPAPAWSTASRRSQPSCTPTAADDGDRPTGHTRSRLALARRHRSAGPARSPAPRHDSMKRCRYIRVYATGPS